MLYYLVDRYDFEGRGLVYGGHKNAPKYLKYNCVAFNKYCAKEIFSQSHVNQYLLQ